MLGHHHSGGGIEFAEQCSLRPAPRGMPIVAQKKAANRPLPAALCSSLHHPSPTQCTTSKKPCCSTRLGQILNIGFDKMVGHGFFLELVLRREVREVFYETQRKTCGRHRRAYSPSPKNPSQKGSVWGPLNRRDRWGVELGARADSLLFPSNIWLDCDNSGSCRSTRFNRTRKQAVRRACGGFGKSRHDPAVRNALDSFSIQAKVVLGLGAVEDCIHGHFLISSTGCHLNGDPGASNVAGFKHCHGVSLGIWCGRCERSVIQGHLAEFAGRVRFASGMTAGIWAMASHSAFDFSFSSLFWRVLPRLAGKIMRFNRRGCRLFVPWALMREFNLATRSIMLN